MLNVSLRESILACFPQFPCSQKYFILTGASRTWNHVEVTGCTVQYVVMITGVLGPFKVTGHTSCSVLPRVIIFQPTREW